MPRPDITPQQLRELKDSLLTPEERKFRYDNEKQRSLRKQGWDDVDIHRVQGGHTDILSVLNGTTDGTADSDRQKICNALFGALKLIPEIYQKYGQAIPQELQEQIADVKKKVKQILINKLDEAKKMADTLLEMAEISDGRQEDMKDFSNSLENIARLLIDNHRIAAAFGLEKDSDAAIFIRHAEFMDLQKNLAKYTVPTAKEIGRYKTLLLEIIDDFTKSIIDKLPTTI